MTGFEYFNYAGTLVIEVQVPSQQPGNSKSWVRKLRGIEQYARQYIPTETDHQYLEAASSQQSVNKLWVTVSIGNKWKFRQSDIKLRQSQSSYQLVVLRRAGCHEADGAVRW